MRMRNYTQIFHQAARVDRGLAVIKWTFIALWIASGAGIIAGLSQSPSDWTALLQVAVLGETVGAILLTWLLAAFGQAHIGLLAQIMVQTRPHSSGSSSVNFGGGKTVVSGSFPVTEAPGCALCNGLPGNKNCHLCHGTGRVYPDIARGGNGGSAVVYGNEGTARGGDGATPGQTHD